MLGPILVALFIWEEPGFPVLMNALGLPSDPLIREIWRALRPAEPFPEYAVTFTDTFGLIAIVGGFLKFWADDQAIEDLGVTGGLKTLTRGDLRSIVVVFVFSLGSLFLIDYPLTRVALIQGALIVALYFSFTVIVTRTQGLLNLPETTRSLPVKIGAFAFILLGCLLTTGLVVSLMQMTEYWI
jgi:uncharacterized integral membrane protein